MMSGGGDAPRGPAPATAVPIAAPATVPASAPAPKVPTSAPAPKVPAPATQPAPSSQGGGVTPGEQLPESERLRLAEEQRLQQLADAYQKMKGPSTGNLIWHAVAKTGISLLVGPLWGAAFLLWDGQSAESKINSPSTVKAWARREQNGEIVVEDQPLRTELGKSADYSTLDAVTKPIAFSMLKKKIKEEADSVKWNDYGELILLSLDEVKKVLDEARAMAHDRSASEDSLASYVRDGVQYRRVLPALQTMQQRMEEAGLGQGVPFGPQSAPAGRGRAAAPPKGKAGGRAQGSASKSAAPFVLSTRPPAAQVPDTKKAEPGAKAAPAKPSAGPKAPNGGKKHSKVLDAL